MGDSEGNAHWNGSLRKITGFADQQRFHQTTDPTERYKIARRMSQTLDRAANIALTPFKPATAAAANKRTIK